MRRNGGDCVAAFEAFLNCARQSTLPRKRFSWVAPEGQCVNWQYVQKTMGRMLAESPLSGTFCKFEWNIETIGKGDNAPQKMSVAVNIS